MTRTQIFSLLVGIIIFAFVGFRLEVQRCDIVGDQWPTLGDVIVILSVTGVALAGIVILFKELTSFRHILTVSFFVFLGLMAGWVAWRIMIVTKVTYGYTAKTSIEVLPPGWVDPFSFRSGKIDKDLYYQFRNDKAAFITQQSSLEDLLRRDKIRNTNWFKKFDNDIPKVVEELQDNLKVKVRRNSNLIELSMTCKDKAESALIVNEMLDLFLKKQQDRATRDVREKLRKVTEQQRRLRTELQQAEDILKTIREGTEFVDLGGTDIPDYITKPLTESEARYRNLEGELSVIANQTATLKSQPEKTNDIKRSTLQKAEDERTALVEQLKIIQNQRDEALQQMKDYDNIRANYAQYISIRDEKQTMLKEMDAHIEKLYAVLESPDISGVKNIGLAPQPLKISSPEPAPYLIGGTLLGLIAGLGFVLLMQTAGKTD